MVAKLRRRAKPTPKKEGVATVKKETKEAAESTSLIASINTDDLFREKAFREHVDVDLENLEQVLQRHPSYHYFYGKLHALSLLNKSRADLKLELLKKELDKVQAQESERIRAEKIAAGDKVTEALIQNEVLISDTYRNKLDEFMSQKLRVVEMEFDAQVLGLAEKVFSKRTDILQTLGFLMGKDGDDVSIRRKEAVRQNRERAKELLSKRRQS